MAMKNAGFYIEKLFEQIKDGVLVSGTHDVRGSVVRMLFDGNNPEAEFSEVCAENGFAAPVIDRENDTFTLSMLTPELPEEEKIESFISTGELARLRALAETAVSTERRS